jgi:hypothetical protein
MDIFLGLLFAGLDYLFGGGSASLGTRLLPLGPARKDPAPLACERVRKFHTGFKKNRFVNRRHLFFPPWLGPVAARVAD